MATLAEAPAEYEKENASPEPAKEPTKRPADETTQQPKKSKQKLTHRYEQADDSDEIDAAVAREWRELVQACATRLKRSKLNVEKAYVTKASIATQLDAIGSVTASRIVKLANQDERSKKEQKFIAESVLKTLERMDKGKTGAFAALQAVVQALAKQAADAVSSETKMGWLSVDQLIEKRDTVSFGNPGDWGVYAELNERIQELKKERTKGSPRTPQ
eukprot:COSAG04_NODE_6_length_47123_cov_87.347482_10_plen_217_part_00